MPESYKPWDDPAVREVQRSLGMDAPGKDSRPYLILAFGYPRNPTGYWMSWGEVLAFARERCAFPQDDADSVAAALARRGWYLLVNQTFFDKNITGTIPFGYFGIEEEANKRS